MNGQCDTGFVKVVSRLDSIFAEPLFLLLRQKAKCRAKCRMRQEAVTALSMLTVHQMHCKTSITSQKKIAVLARSSCICLAYRTSAKENKILRAQKAEDSPVELDFDLLSRCEAVV